VKRDRKKIVTGIDVGTTKVCTLIAEIEPPEGFRIIGVDYSDNEGMEKGQVVNLDAVTQSIYQSLGKAEKSAGWVIDSAYINIAGSHVTANRKRGTANITDPVRGIMPDDLRRVIDDSKNLLLPADKQIVDVVDLEYTVDGQSGIRDPLGMSGSHLEVLVQIITGSSSFVQNLTKCVLKVGIQIDGIVYSPMAAGEAVLNRDEKEVGIILLDIGGGTTDVAIFQGGHMRNGWSIPVGGHHVDNDIAVRFGISHKEAERVKIEYGRTFLDGRDEGDPVELNHVGGQDKTQVPKGMICQIIQPRIGELLGMVQADLEENMPSTVLPAGVVVTGGTAQMDGMKFVVEQILGYNVRIGRPIYEGDRSEEIAGPGYATALGLIKFALVHSPRRALAAGGKGITLKNLPQIVTGFIRGLIK